MRPIQRGRARCEPSMGEDGECSPAARGRKCPCGSRPVTGAVCLPMSHHEYNTEVEPRLDAFGSFEPEAFLFLRGCIGRPVPGIVYRMMPCVYV